MTAPAPEEDLSARPETGATARDALPGNLPSIPEILVTIPDDRGEGALVFSVSLCRWLLAAFERVELISEPPSPAEWSSVVQELMGQERAELEAPLAGGSLSINDHLRILFADDPLHTSPPACPPQEDARANPWALLPAPEALPTTVRVRVVIGDAFPENRAWLHRASLCIALLPDRIEAFIRYYLMIRATVSRRERTARFYTILDRTGPDHGLKKIRMAWDSVTERFLGWTVPILGQVDYCKLPDARQPIHGRIRACEESLGPPWPSDLQHHCRTGEAPRVVESPSSDQPRDDSPFASLSRTQNAGMA